MQQINKPTQINQLCIKEFNGFNSFSRANYCIIIKVGFTISLVTITSKFESDKQKTIEPFKYKGLIPFVLFNW